MIQNLFRPILVAAAVASALFTRRFRFIGVLRASTPVRHGGPRVRKKHIRSARVPEIENFHTGAVAEDERRGAGGREDLPGHGLGGGHLRMPASRQLLMAQSICGCLGDAQVTVASDWTGEEGRGGGGGGGGAPAYARVCCVWLCCQLKLWLWAGLSL